MDRNSCRAHGRMGCVAIRLLLFYLMTLLWHTMVMWRSRRCIIVRLRDMNRQVMLACLRTLWNRLSMWVRADRLRVEIGLL